MRITGYCEQCEALRGFTQVRRASAQHEEVRGARVLGGDPCAVIFTCSHRGTLVTGKFQ